MIESSSTRFRPSDPLPVPVLAVTVYVAPLPVTPVMLGVVSPLFARPKSPVPTPVTFSLNVTVQLTVVALVGLVPVTIEETVGGVVSATTSALVIRRVPFGLPVLVPPVV